MPFDVLLVEDHAIVRDGIKAILDRSEDFRVTGEADSGARAVQFCKQNSPHIVLMDLELPGLNGVDATSEVLRHCPSTKVVVLSMHEDDHHVIGAIRAGARGFILNRANLADLLEALRTIARGGSYLSPQVSDKLLSRIQRGNLETDEAPSGLDVLSPRELQVLRLIAEGKTSKDIAVMLDLSTETVRSYRKTMMKKLGLNNVASLTQLALSAGLTQPTYSSNGFAEAAETA
jgi:DNA-binding NarL/FixJ family response regulator